MDETTNKATPKPPEPAAGDTETPEAAADLELLREAFRAKGRVLVALSGGVDSSLLAETAHTTLGAANAIAVTIKSETMQAPDFAAVAELARSRGWNHRVLEYSELALPGFADNPPDRCYLCKLERYARLTRMAAEWGCAAVADGTNADDTGDYRPGRRALAESGVWTPLLDLGIGKVRIRAMSHALDLPNWAKPAGACLATRFPCGERLTPEALARVAAAEAAVRAQGFPLVRVRCHGPLARVEVAGPELARLVHPETAAAIAAELKKLGFKFVAADLQGYTTGSMNALNPAE